MTMKDADYERELQKLYTMALAREDLPTSVAVLEKLLSNEFSLPPIVVPDELRFDNPVGV